MISDYKKINLKKIIVFLLIGASTLQTCLASLKIKDKPMSDRALDGQRFYGNLKPQPKNIKQQDLLPESPEITRMMGIARLLNYSAKKSMSAIQHPFAENLCILFKHFTNASSDKKQVTEAIKKIKRILNKVNDTNFPNIVLTQAYFLKIFLILGEFLMNLSGKFMLYNYLNNPFLKENFVLDKFYKNQKMVLFLNFSQSIDKNFSLYSKVSRKNLFYSDLIYNSIYPDFIYFIVNEEDQIKVPFFDPTKNYQFRYIDQHKAVLYRLFGFLTEEGENVYSYVYENKQWARFINNKKLCEKIWTPCPLVVMYEKYAEFYRKTSISD